MSTQEIIYKTHLVSVILFLLIYLVKTILLLSNSKEKLQRFTKIFKVPEMIISVLFLGTGIYMITGVPKISTHMIIKLVCVAVSIPLAVIGFKKGNKILAVISLLLIITAYGMAEIHKKKAAGPAVDKTIVEGKPIYEQKCVSCHGADGKLGLNDAPDLTTSAMDAAAMTENIKNGKNMMPAFKEQLTEEQIKALVEYVKEMKK